MTISYNELDPVSLDSALKTQQTKAIESMLSSDVSPAQGLHHFRRKQGGETHHPPPTNVIAHHDPPTSSPSNEATLADRTCSPPSPPVVNRDFRRSKDLSTSPLFHEAIRNNLLRKAAMSRSPKNDDLSCESGKPPQHVTSPTKGWDNSLSLDQRLVLKDEVSRNFKDLKVITNGMSRERVRRRSFTGKPIRGIQRRRNTSTATLEEEDSSDEGMHGPRSPTSPFTKITKSYQAMRDDVDNFLREDNAKSLNHELEEWNEGREEPTGAGDELDYRRSRNGGQT